ncbi:PTS system N-acetylgalactosamine-specific EIIC component 1 [Alloiococcus otitis]|uniref:PTS system, mannose/fructose/sorbose family, IIC component n=1 Tax=Alloiococcus otitis ATCC 51267 TaxID=883081 RepID=K9E9P5_9LACT|nr:PTS sugar transporter subunit IIC [Alloiococcus otitis]EKU93919.1 hypothetical protein HMPREF9698_00596 [Alloiococcus otitis ATCC 51267]SUU81745.1 PTS system N-acetylgalactosamine-specific EIIC component 1 [Alloiococcus otitis]
MQDISTLQIILLTLLAVLGGIDPYIAGLQLSRPVIAGFFAGLIMGDLTTGLLVGATLQLMVLGVGTFGGATIPDFATGAIIGTALAVVADGGVEFAVGVSVPVGLLMVQLDILARFCGVYFSHRVDTIIDKMEFDKIVVYSWLSLIPMALSRAIPVALSLVFGNNIVNLILNYVPDWLMGGLEVAGAVLPVVGIGILLQYLPVKRFFGFLLIGYLLAAYFQLPLMGVAVAGFAAAFIYYMVLQNNDESNDNNQVAQTSSAQVDVGKGEILDDEL